MVILQLIILLYPIYSFSHLGVTIYYLKFFLSTSLSHYMLVMYEIYFLRPYIGAISQFVHLPHNLSGSILPIQTTLTQ
jgi:hypothetical protein